MKFYTKCMKIGQAREDNFGLRIEDFEWRIEVCGCMRSSAIDLRIMFRMQEVG
jgi:hypothetical protein